MTISNENFKKQVTLSSSPDSAIATLIYVQNATDITVVRTRANVDTTLSQGSSPGQYGVTDVRVAAGCTVTPVGGVEDDFWTITRDVPLTQTGDYIANAAFDPVVNEDGHDKSRMLDQQIQELLGRTVQFPESEDASVDYGNVLDSATTRAGKTLAFDANGFLVATDGDNIGAASITKGFSESVAIAATPSIATISLDTDKNALVTLLFGIDGRSYLKKVEYSIHNKAGTISVELGKETTHKANTTGGEFVNVTVGTGVGVLFGVTIDGAGLTGTRTISVRIKVESPSDNSVGITEI